MLLHDMVITSSHDQQPEKVNFMATKNQNAISDAVQNFHLYSESVFIRPKDIAAILGCSLPTTYRMTKDGRLPPIEQRSPGMAGLTVGQLRRSKAMGAKA